MDTKNSETTVNRIGKSLGIAAEAMAEGAIGTVEAFADAATGAPTTRRVMPSAGTGNVTYTYEPAEKEPTEKLFCELAFSGVLFMAFLFFMLYLLYRCYCGAMAIHRDEQPENLLFPGRKGEK